MDKGKLNGIVRIEIRNKDGNLKFKEENHNAIVDGDKILTQYCIAESTEYGAVTGITLYDSTGGLSGGGKNVLNNYLNSDTTNNGLDSSSSSVDSTNNKAVFTIEKELNNSNENSITVKSVGLDQYYISGSGTATVYYKVSSTCRDDQGHIIGGGYSTLSVTYGSDGTSNGTGSGSTYDPTNFSATLSGTSVSLSWSSPSATCTTVSYTLGKSTDGGTSYTTIASGNIESFNDTISSTNQTADLEEFSTEDLNSGNGYTLDSGDKIKITWTINIAL